MESYEKRFKIKGIVFGVLVALLALMWNYVVDGVIEVGNQIKGVMRIVTFERIKKSKSVRNKLVQDGVVKCLQ